MYTASKSDTLVSESVGIVVVAGINTVTLLGSNLSPVATSPSSSVTATTSNWYSTPVSKSSIITEFSRLDTLTDCSVVFIMSLTVVDYVACYVLVKDIKFIPGNFY